MKKKPTNFALLTAADLSFSQTSNPLFVEDYDRGSIQATFSGSPVGTVSLQISNDQGVNPTSNPADVKGVVNWTTLPAYTQAISASGSVVWSLEEITWSWARISYTRTSGTGSLTVRGMIKDSSRSND